MDPYKVVKHPLITEKSMTLGMNNQYVFEVARAANKVEIAKAIEAIFADVEVEKVRTLNVKAEQRAFGSRSRKKPARKKAIVTLKKGHIDLAV